MSVHVFPSGATGVRAWQLHPHESCVQCGQQHVSVLLLECYFSGGREEAEEMFVTTGWLVLSREPNSQLV